METDDFHEIIDTLERCFILEDEHKSTYAPLNIVGAMDRTAYNLGRIAESITPMSAVPMETPGGGQVGSLTEAVIYAAENLKMIADSIGDLAEAVRERG
jgi:hypothetical protein